MLPHFDASVSYALAEIPNCTLEQLLEMRKFVQNVTAAIDTEIIARIARDLQNNNNN